MLIDDPTPAGVMRTMKLAEYEGANAFDLELQGLDREHRNPEALRQVLRRAPESVKPALLRAIAESVAGYEKALKATEIEKP